MLTKTIEVEVVGKTFPGKTVPPGLACPGTIPVDLAHALLMLGGLTSPSGFSSASPARYWAWLRYFSAISSTPDLRITAPFIDLDPHQKTILSDDLGVAISTKWLFDRLGGFAEIVDGRRFMLQYASLINRPKRKTPKVGIGKCPDFVIRDFANRWHVIECKGTQSDRAYRNRQLNAAYMQKQVIDIKGAARGERLAVGIYLGNEREDPTSHLRVIDPPEVEPYVVIDASDRQLAITATNRLAVSRALAMSGFDAISEELSLPTEVDGLSELYTPVERARLSRSPEERWSAVAASLKPAELEYFTIGTQEFIGRQAVVPISGEEFFRNTNCKKIRVTQGISSSFVEDLRVTGSRIRSEIDAIGDRYLQKSGIELETHGLEVTLRDSQLYAARMEFIP